jgi:hypothetical protein
LRAPQQVCFIIPEVPEFVFRKKRGQFGVVMGCQVGSGCASRRLG